MTLGWWTVAFARPEDLSGPRSYSADDVLESMDVPSGRLRIHWSSAGPNVVDDGDADADGIPDYVTMAAGVADEALALFEAEGFRPPLHESEVGLSELGGSDAIDVYLVDFAGTADGAYTPDRCSAGTCAGHLLVENDFKDYGYPSDLVALRTVVPHELFHAVQGAYRDDLESWASEGQATWAERLFEPESADYLRFVRAYFEEPTRPVYEPPIGPVPVFSYSTAIWFDFLATRYDTAVNHEILLAWADGGDEQRDPMIAAIEARGDAIEDVWTGFATWNLATGEYAGAIDGYDYAEDVGPPVFEATAELLDDDNRFYPLATTYYRLDHPGGPVWFGLEEAAPGIVFSVHAAPDGAVEPALFTVDGADPTVRAVGDAPAGLLYVWGAQPGAGDASIKVRFCAGQEADVAACFAAEPPDDTGPADTGGDDGKGCGCTSGPGGTGAFGLLGLVALRASRARARR